MGIIILSVCTVALFILSVLLKPEIKIGKIKFDSFFLFPLVGAILCRSLGYLPLSDLMSALFSKGEMNPLKILVLFFSMTVMSLYLDEAGFFRYLAAKSAGSSGKLGFFIRIYALVSILTIFTSNDVVILTFTPFICAYAKRLRISPFPYLMMEFVAANTWSMLFIVGNPTNIYIAASLGADFFHYLKIMFLPAIAAGGVSFLALLLLFKNELKERAELAPIEEKIELDKPLVALSLSALGLCVLALVVSSFLPNVQMWYISLGFALLLTVVVAVVRLARKEKAKYLFAAYKRLPYAIAPFLVSMFILVLALKEQGVTAKIASLIPNEGEIFSYGGISYLAANLLNNIPMSVLFAEICPTAGAKFAAIVSSNLGALLTPVGALAGIMFTKITATYGEEIKVYKFVLCGAAVSIPALAASLGALLVTL